VSREASRDSTGWHRTCPLSSFSSRSTKCTAACDAGRHAGAVKTHCQTELQDSIRRAWSAKPASVTGIAGEDTVGVDDGSPTGRTVILALHPPNLSGGHRAPPLVSHQHSCHQRCAAGSIHRIVVRRYRDGPQRVRGAFGPVPVPAIPCRSITAAATNATAARGCAPRKSPGPCRGARQPGDRDRPLDP